MKTVFKHILLCLLGVTILFSCRDRIKENSTGALEYSVDTIMFDTIFTDEGTRTLRFKVYNNTDGRIVVDKMSSSKGTSSEYIINVDGVMLSGTHNFDILPNDSLYVFVQAKLKEQGVDTALMYMEHLQVEYNDRLDEIPIVSFGQDVYRFYGESIETQEWSGRKPYIIRDSLHVKEGHTLTIKEGVTVYCHAGSSIKVDGNLRCEGTLEEPVVFQQDNLDPEMNKYPEQWGSIILRNPSSNYYFNYTDILRGTVGILAQFDEYDESSSITIENTRIMQEGYGAVVLHNANLKATNVIIAHNTRYGLSVSGNGNHHIVHSTFKFGGRAYESKRLPLLQIQDSVISGDLTISVQNSIIDASLSDGSVRDAIGFPDDSISNWTASIQNSVVTMEDKIETMSQFESSVQVTNTHQFYIFGEEYEYILDSTSEARNLGNPDFAQDADTDYLGAPRLIDEAPDAGAYEYFLNETDTE